MFADIMKKHKHEFRRRRNYKPPLKVGAKHDQTKYFYFLKSFIKRVIA